MTGLSPESAAVAAERHTQARCGLLSTVEVGQYIDGLFDEVTNLLAENAVLRQRLQRVESALAATVSERDEARTDLLVARLRIQNLESLQATTQTALDTARALSSLGWPA